MDVDHPATPRAAPTNLPCTSAGFAELSAAILGEGVALRFRALGKSMAPLVRDGDVVTQDDADTILAHLPRQLGQNGVTLGDLDAKEAAGEDLCDNSVEFDRVVPTHRGEV